MKQQVSKTPTRLQRVNATRQAFRTIFRQLFVVRLANAVADWVLEDLTFAQFKALVMLAHHSQLTLGQLARLLNVGSPTASIVVQQLVARGLVDRAEGVDDRRRSVLRLSERGKGLLAEGRKERLAQLDRWFDQLDDDELNGLLRGLQALGDAMDAESAETPAHAATAPATPARKPY